MRVRTLCRLGLTVSALVALVLLACGDDCAVCPPPDDVIAAIQRDFPTSLHGSRPGKATFYSAPDGFQSLTNVPMDSLACAQCHGATYADGTPVVHATYTPGCLDCHRDPSRPNAYPVTEQICLGCHSRQGAEQSRFADVHREAGMDCIDCHTQREMHGDGVAYASFLSPGASDAKCSNCHFQGGSAPPPASNAYHNTHASTLDCSACHVRSVSTCYNCHFETEVATDLKRFFNQSPRTGFRLLVNFEGKVQSGTFMALSYEGHTFAVVAPFHGHSITKTGITCAECHLGGSGGGGNPILQEYVDSSQMTVTRWDAAATGADRLVGPTGVIPVPPDWQAAFKIDFLTYNGLPTDPINGPANLPNWGFLKTGADGKHMPFGTPLTTDQMNSLINN